MIKTYLHSLRLFSRNTRLYLATNMLTSISYTGMYVMLFNLYLLRVGYGTEFIGLINAAAQLGVAVFSIPAGMLGQRWGVRRMVIVGLSVATIGLGLVPLAEFVPTGWRAVWLVVMYIVAWLGGALYVVNSLPFVVSKTNVAQRAHVLSVREALVPLSLFAGSLIGGLLPGFLAACLGATLADPAPYRYALFISAALFSVAPLTFLATTGTKAKEPHRQQRWASSPEQPAQRSAAPSGPIVLMAAVMLLQLAGKSVTDTYFNVYLDVRLHLSPAWIGTLSAIAQLLVVPVALTAPVLLIRWGKRWTIIAGALGMALSLLLLAMVPHWGVAGLGLMGVSALFAITTLAFSIYTQELVSPGWRATMSGAMAMAMGLSRSTMAFGGGHLITTFGFSSVFLVGAGLTAAGAILFWGYTWLPRRYILYRAGLKATP